MGIVPPPPTAKFSKKITKSKKMALQAFVWLTAEAAEGAELRKLITPKTPGKQKSEIRISKSETNSKKINLKLGKSKTPNPNQECFEFCVFQSIEFVSNFGFRASKFILGGLCARYSDFFPALPPTSLCGNYCFTVNPEESSFVTTYPTARTSCRSTSAAAAFWKSASLKE